MESGNVFIGYFDGSRWGKTFGWAWNPFQPDETIEVDLYVDGQFWRRVRADQHRADLERMSYGNGYHSFCVPEELAGNVEARFAKTGVSLPSEPVRSFCHLPSAQLVVSPVGDVSMCCYQKESIGNILSQPFEEVWFSPLAEEIRKDTLESKLHSVCVGWGACPFITEPKSQSDWVLPHSYPIFLDLYLPNTHCNIGGTSPTPESACFMCARSVEGFVPDTDLTDAVVARLRPLMPLFQQIRIQGVAEPFWKGRVFDVLKGLGFERFKNTCKLELNTNGTVFTTERQTQLLETCPKADLYFSLDAATPETYVAVRRLDLFERAVANIAHFMKIRRETQTVYVTNNINLKNIHESIEMVRLAKRLGVDGVVFNPTHDGGLKRPELEKFLVNAENAPIFRRAHDAVCLEAAKHDIRVIFIRRLDLGLGLADRRDFHSAAIPLY